MACRRRISTSLLRTVTSSNAPNHFSALSSGKATISHFCHLFKANSTISRHQNSATELSEFRGAVRTHLILLSQFSTSSFSSQLANEDSYALNWETAADTTNQQQQQHFASLAPQLEPEMASSSMLEAYLEEEPEETTSSDMAPFVEPTDIYVPVKAFFISRRFVDLFVHCASKWKWKTDSTVHSKSRP